MSSNNYEDTNEGQSLVIEKENFNIKLISKLQEIDSVYKKNLYRYRQGLQQYTLEIKALKGEISLQEQIVKGEEKKVFLIESALLHDEKLLEKLHAKLFQKIDSLYELQHEYKKLLEADKFEESVLRKEEDIAEVLADVEELELSFLNKELERLNLVTLLTPKEKELKALYVKLEALEEQKRYFESSDLDEGKLPSGVQEFVEDVEVLAEEKSSDN